MKRFYKIPMTERIVMTGNVSLIEILKEQYPELHERELCRIELTYGHNNPGYMTPELEKTVADYNEETAIMYKAMEIPQYIIARQEDEGEITEHVTGTKLTVRCNSILYGREINVIDAYQYMNSIPKYSESVHQFFENEKEKDKNKNPIKKLVRFITKKDN